MSVTPQRSAHAASPHLCPARRRPGAHWLWLTLAAWTSLPGAGAPAASADWASEVDALFTSQWIFEGEVRASGGWNSNALLASNTPTGTGFSREEVETSLLRASPDGPWQFFTMLTGSETQFFDTPEAPSARSWFWHVGTRWNPPKGRWNVGASLQAYHQRQVIDLSENAAEPLIARLGLRGLSSQLSVRLGHELGPYLDASTDVSRHDFQGAPEDADEIAGLLRGGWKWASFELAATGGLRQRRYDHREPYTVLGRPLTGQRLTFHSEEGTLHAVARQRWHGEWELRAEVSRANVDDNRSGWFDSIHDEGRASIEWSQHPWRIRLDGSLGRTANPRQYIVRAGQVQTRERRDRVGQAEVERALPKGWLLFARTDRTLSTSNDPRLTYAVNGISAGVGWKF